MLSPLRNRFGIPGVISVIALVFAMFGGAFAATNSGGGKATSSAKAKKGPRGPRGPQGPAGPAGPAGAQGPAGPKGDTGPQGKEGAQGKEGPQGKAGKDGKDGKDGETGFTEMLPGGMTETGAWSYGSVPGISGGSEFEKVGGESGLETQSLNAQSLRVPLSFSIPLAEELDADHVHYINPDGKEVTDSGPTDSTVCTGEVADPTAAIGHLCVYATVADGIFFTGSSFIKKVAPEGVTGASRSGAILLFLVAAEGAAGQGTWAVTAEEE